MRPFSTMAIEALGTPVNARTSRTAESIRAAVGEETWAVASTGGFADCAPAGEPVSMKAAEPVSKAGRESRAAASGIFLPAKALFTCTSLLMRSRRGVPGFDLAEEPHDSHAEEGDQSRPAKDVDVSP